MQLFSNAIFGYGLIKWRKIAFRAGSGAIA